MSCDDCMEALFGFVSDCFPFCEWFAVLDAWFLIFLYCINYK
jgi:hypothetical protein